jgi:hypothetical protein
VNDTYILFKWAVDQFIGQIIAGLSIHQHTFAVLPHRFGADGVSFCGFVFFCVFVFCSFLYIMPLTSSPTCFSILQEAVMKLMERVYPISVGTPRPLIGVLITSV